MKMSCKYKVILGLLILLFSPSCFAQSRVEFQLNSIPTTVYNVNNYADKVLVNFYDIYGAYHYLSFLELDLISRTVTYTNAAPDASGLYRYVECTASYDQLPIENADVNKVFGIEFDLPCMDKGAFHGILYWEFPAFPNDYIAPICDAAQASISSLSTSLNKFGTENAALVKDNALLKKDIVRLKKKIKKLQSRR